MTGLKTMLFHLELLVLTLLSGMLSLPVKENNFTRLCSSQCMMAVNDSFPGPVIHVHRGDTAYVNVHNEGDYGFTLHWHGVKQPRNPWSDGPDHITQCQIEPGTNFTYEWHAHSDWTRASIHGAIVVLPTEGTTYPYPKPDAEEIIVLGSWYLGDVKKELDYDLINTAAGSPEEAAYTINSLPGELVTCSSDPPYSLSVDYGKTYLLRIVNVVVHAELFFAISQHNLTAVGTDATYTKTLVTDYIMIAPGQTMDVLVTANQTPSSYYMAAKQFVTVDPTQAGYVDMNVTAILEYSGNYTPPASPSFPANFPSYHQLDKAYGFVEQLRSLANTEHPVNVPLNITTRMFITASLNVVSYKFEGAKESHIATSLNNISFMDPSSSMLNAYYKYSFVVFCFLLFFPLLIVDLFLNYYYYYYYYYKKYLLPLLLLLLFSFYCGGDGKKMRL
ncbi:hypothetical protein PVL29_024365 [Vitis rotundifolia]|uniref:laccase n=1 Tax=Vitis rotundifolia TaxID=103349 RepID=A0AA38YRS3_VITRO|nr:hypothetical protein PVL29_024365 [Vitis rotundifolia]